MCFVSAMIVGMPKRLVYQVNSTIDLTIGFDRTHDQELFAGGETIAENVAQISLHKRF